MHVITRTFRGMTHHIHIPASDIARLLMYLDCYRRNPEVSFTHTFIE